MDRLVVIGGGNCGSTASHLGGDLRHLVLHICDTPKARRNRCHCGRHSSVPRTPQRLGCPRLPLVQVELSPRGGADRSLGRQHIDTRACIATDDARVSRLSRCRNATSVMPQQPVYERHERCGRKTTKPQAEARKCPAKFADGENLRGTDAMRRNTGCDPACAPAFDSDEI